MIYFRIVIKQLNLMVKKGKNNEKDIRHLRDDIMFINDNYIKWVRIK